MSEELFWLSMTALLTGVIWMPYTVERILRIGLFPAVGYAKESGSAGFAQSEEKPPVWAVRAHAAHRNAVETFPVFAALVIVANLAGIGAGMVAVAAQIYFWGRLAHFIFYVLGVPLARTLAFFVGFGAMAFVAYTLLGM